jgi:hypothetical protein
MIEQQDWETMGRIKRYVSSLKKQSDPLYKKSIDKYSSILYDLKRKVVAVDNV